MAFWRGGAAVALTAALMVAACGSSSDCEETRTCSGSQGGTAGVGGNGGTGGAAGTGAAGTGAWGGGSACQGDAECDDGEACTGQEKCVNGSCQKGTPVACPNPDSAHCDGVCVEVTGGGTNCRTVGRDVDGDGHLDSACTASEDAADDCDDNQKTVYPGATEVCDGLDNDCNGKDELEEGAKLSGAAVDFASGTPNAQDPAIVWSATQKQYGVVWVGEVNAGASRQIFFARMDATGKKLGATGTEDVPVSLVSQTCAAPRIAERNGQFAVVWQETQTENRVFFRLVGAGGVPVGNPKQISDTSSKVDAPDIAATSSGWVVVWRDRRGSTFGQLYARALGTDGTPAGSTDTQIGSPSGVNVQPRIAAGASDLLVAWGHRAISGEPNVVRALRMDATLNVKSEGSVTADPPSGSDVAFRPAAAQSSTGWALTWRNSGGSESAGWGELAANGTPSCTPGWQPALNGGFPGGIAVRGDRRLIAYGENYALEASVKLLRFKAGCGSPLVLDIGPSETPSFEPRGVDVAWGDSGAAVVWTDWASGKAVIRRFVTGPNLCDDPIP